MIKSEEVSMSEEIEVAFGGPEEAVDGEVAATSATPDIFSQKRVPNSLPDEQLFRSADSRSDR